MVFDVIGHNHSDYKIITFVLKSLKRKICRTKTEVIGLIFALTSTTDGIRRYTAQPFRLQYKNLVL